VPEVRSMVILQTAANRRQVREVESQSGYARAAIEAY
jgi:hypothetical protein